MEVYKINVLFYAGYSALNRVLLRQFCIFEQALIFQKHLNVESHSICIRGRKTL